jgi:hypothetical protein
VRLQGLDLVEACLAGGVEPVRDATADLLEDCFGARNEQLRMRALTLLRAVIDKAPRSSIPVSDLTLDDKFWSVLEVVVERGVAAARGIAAARGDSGNTGSDGSFSVRVSVGAPSLRSGGPRLVR